MILDYCTIFIKEVERAESVGAADRKTRMTSNTSRLQRYIRRVGDRITLTSLIICRNFC